jgi:hypothetical protein
MSEMNRKKILKIGAYIHSLSLVLRTVMKTVFTIALVQGFGGISWALLHLPFQSIFYNNSKKGGIAYTTYYREVFLQLGRLVGALIFVIFLFLFDAKMSLVFSIIFGAIAVFVMMRIRDE